MIPRNDLVAEELLPQSTSREDAGRSDSTSIGPSVCLPSTPNRNRDTTVITPHVAHAEGKGSGTTDKSNRACGVPKKSGHLRSSPRVHVALASLDSEKFDDDELPSDPSQDSDVSSPHKKKILLPSKLGRLSALIQSKKSKQFSKTPELVWSLTPDQRVDEMRNSALSDMGEQFWNYTPDTGRSDASIERLFRLVDTPGVPAMFFVFKKYMCLRHYQCAAVRINRSAHACFPIRKRDRLKKRIRRNQNTFVELQKETDKISAQIKSR